MGVPRRCRRFPEDSEDSAMECTGKLCRSCTATMVADCIALCCCPCAVVSLLFLTFFKVPWAVGRRCLRALLSRRKSSGNGKVCREERRECCLVMAPECWDQDVVVPRLKIDVINGGGDDNWCTGFEAEKVWLELYQAGRLGFGRVSFKG